MDGLPDEVRAVMAEPEAKRNENLDNLGRALARMRKEAVDARKQSGIEHIWLECEEAYLGIDDENRSEFQGAKWAKPMSMDGGLRAERLQNSSDQVKATAFVSMTARYVDAGTAKVCEISLPIDGKAFALKATAVPEGSKEDETPAEQVTGQPMPGPDGQPVTVGALATHAASKYEKAAQKAANRIHDWMTEAKHPAEMRKVVFDMARLGVGVLKGPIPEVRKATVVRKKRMDGGKTVVEVERVSKIKPAARWVDPWCFYPAPGCGEDIHNGGHCFESAPMLEHELQALAKQADQFYIAAAIKQVIEEGPGKKYAEGVTKSEERTDKQYEVWHFHGLIDRADFEAVNPEQAKDLKEDQTKVFVMATMVNDTVIRAVMSPLDSNRLPYRVASWRRRIGHWAGRGVAESIRTPQRVVNAATRAMLNNAGKSSGAQVVMDPALVEPANSDPRIVGDKLWFIKAGNSVEDVRKIFAAFNWPNTTPQLMSVIEYAFKLAEECSNIPLITQGQSGKTTPDTFGGQQLQDNNANQLLRDVGFGINDQITSPLVDDYYDWLLADPDVPDDEKGDYQVDTSGALALIEKALQDMTILQMGAMVLNPAFGLNPKRYAQAWLRSKRLVPADFEFTEEELKKMAEAPPPKSDAVQAAEIRAQATIEAAKSRDQLSAEKIRVDTDRDNTLVESQERRDASLAALRLEELRLKRDLALMEYAKEERLSLQDAKVQLARDTMKLNLQRELAGADGKGPQVAEPVVEPEGRAEEGQAYQQ